MVKQAIEVEFKFEVTDPAKTAFLNELECIDQKHVNDIYLDTPDGACFCA